MKRSLLWEGEAGEKRAQIGRRLCYRRHALYSANNFSVAIVDFPDKN